MSNPDQETLLRAVGNARRILGEYIRPGRATQHEPFSVSSPYSTRKRPQRELMTLGPA
jgi:hypothetical protein